MSDTSPQLNQPEEDSDMSTLNLQIPKEAYRRVKHAAIDSDLPLKVYVAKLLMNAKPILPHNENDHS